MTQQNETLSFSKLGRVEREESCHSLVSFSQFECNGYCYSRGIMVIPS